MFTDKKNQMNCKYFNSAPLILTTHSLIPVNSALPFKDFNIFKEA